MLFSLYLLTILYTNTMGLIIIAKCNPIINREIELKGYKIVEKDEVDTVINILLNSLKFLIPGYFLKKAINLTNKDYNVDKLIEQKLKSKEIINDDETQVFNSIFKSGNDNLSLSLGKYEKPSLYKSSSNTMYTDERKFNHEEVDMDFWEEEVSEIPSLEENIDENIVIKKEPLQEYLDSISEEELISMAMELDKIRKLKKENEKLLNDKAA